MADLLEDLERRRYREPLLCRRPWSTRYRVNRLLSRPVAALALAVTLALPLFVNTYLTIKAHQAVVEMALLPVRQANQAQAAHLRDLGPPYQEKLKHLPAGYHYYLYQHGKSQGDAPDLAELQRSPRTQMAYYDRSGRRWIGAWHDLPAAILLTETESAPALVRADDIPQPEFSVEYAYSDGGRWDGGGPVTLQSTLKKTTSPRTITRGLSPLKCSTSWHRRWSKIKAEPSWERTQNDLVSAGEPGPVAEIAFRDGHLFLAVVHKTSAPARALGHLRSSRRGSRHEGAPAVAVVEQSS